MTIETKRYCKYSQVKQPCLIAGEQSPDNCRAYLLSVARDIQDKKEK